MKRRTWPQISPVQANDFPKWIRWKAARRLRESHKSPRCVPAKAFAKSLPAGEPPPQGTRSSAPREDLEAGPRPAGER
jgi:hypothetical protein